jgi:hypothetical protein
MISDVKDNSKGPVNTAILVDPMPVEDGKLRQNGDLRGRRCRCLSTEMNCRGFCYLLPICFISYGAFFVYKAVTIEETVTENFDLTTTRIIGGSLATFVMVFFGCASYLLVRSMAPRVVHSDPRFSAQSRLILQFP